MPFVPLYNADPVPDGRLDARHADSWWQAYFRLHVHSAYDAVREYLIVRSMGMPTCRKTALRHPPQ